MTKVYKNGAQIVIEFDNGNDTIYIPSHLTRISPSDNHISIIDMFPSYEDSHAIMYADLANESGVKLNTKVACVAYLSAIIGTQSSTVKEAIPFHDEVIHTYTASGEPDIIYYKLKGVELLELHFSYLPDGKLDKLQKVYYV